MSDKNYTPVQEKELLDVYNPKATQDERDAMVKKLAESLGKKTRSIVAKLSRMELYVAKVRTTKTGAPVVQKSDIVATIAKLVGATSESFASFAKATKADLQAFSNALAESLPAKEAEAEAEAETVS